jgi:hypothetical protein
MGKICSKCKIEKELVEYHKHKSSKDGIRDVCKECRKEETNLYYQKNSIKLMEKSQEYRLNNPEKIKDGLKKYREKNSESLKENKRIWSKSLEGKKSKQKYYKNNIDDIKEKVKIYKKNNPEKEIERRNSEKRKKYMENYLTKYRKEKSYFIVWRSVLRNTLKRVGTKKENTTNELLGYSAIQLKEHIEKQFVDNMCWENWGEWHIDHIKPVSSFDKSEKMSIINSLDNLQPLWAVDNLKKSNKIIN